MDGIKLLNLEKRLSNSGLSFKRKISQISRDDANIIYIIGSDGEVMPTFLSAYPINNFNFEDPTLNENASCERMKISSGTIYPLSELRSCKMKELEGKAQELSRKYGVLINKENEDAGYFSYFLEAGNISQVIDSIFKVKNADVNFKTAQEKMLAYLKKWDAEKK